ncbi:acylneuraminate cytidylyltransferase family protein [Geitlerinema sp. P-1104]|uniref:acylneuraminate cytidylyltransferase family protein n=1 Tax=Geitlerinema sp. P-1104 TaxID=2546230 RepID=UPI0014773C8D|nr:acylneuraminate cytidylyltransferase family protein [Geitlerinema sp. P-1104]NMG59561.1 acylneuraminate cytidylyltransferase family protein [Geitlerinema sp. P-1104]
MNKIVAIVPMRHNSERVPQKNYRDFCGRPLYHYITNSLLSCPLISEVFIDTDSPIIMEDAVNNFPRARLLERPENLRAGTVPMNDVLLNTIEQIESDFYLQTHSTNPLVTSKTITGAVQNFLDNYPLFDSLFSVTRLQTRLWDSLTRAVNHNPAILLRTQDLPPIYEENSCLYIFTRGTMKSRHNRIGHRPLMFEMDRVESVDIDEEFDFQVAEFLYQAQKS